MEQSHLMDEARTTPPPQPPTTRPRLLRTARFRYSPVSLLGALILMIVVTPFVEELDNGDLVESILLTLVLGSGVLAVGARRRNLAWAALLVAPAISGKWLSYFWPDLLPHGAFQGAGMLFLIFVIWHLFRFILDAPRVDSEVVCAGISTYLMLGFFWAIAYALVGRLNPQAFLFSSGPDTSHTMIGFTAFYFSFITLSTVGYGDIIPVSKAARMLAVTESVTGIFYVAILISRLVAVYSRRHPNDSGDHE